VAETLREELEELIVHELTDPRIRVTAVAEVLMSTDARRARVRLMLEGGAREQAETLAALEHAKGYIRREIASRIDLFRTPDLQFESALPADMGDRMASLLKRVRRGRPRPESEA
jgi:ribosome-binding factor A